MQGIEEKSKIPVKSTEDIAEDVGVGGWASFASNSTGHHQSWAQHFLSCHSLMDQNVTFLKVRLNKGMFKAAT